METQKKYLKLELIIIVNISAKLVKSLEAAFAPYINKIYEAINQWMKVTNQELEEGVVFGQSQKVISGLKI